MRRKSKRKPPNHRRRQDDPSLDSSSDLNMVLLERTRIPSSEICFRHFRPHGRRISPDIELMKNGQMPTSETMFGKLLNSMFGDQKPRGRAA